MPGATATHAVALVLAGCLLSGCAQEDPSDLPEYDPAATGPRPTAAVTEATRRPVERDPAPAPSVRYRPADALGRGAWVERGRVEVTSSRKKAAVDAVQKYLSVRVQLSNTWVVDEPALAAVASGVALTTARDRAASQREQKRRSIGRLILNVSSVRLDGDNGDTATVTGCDFDATSEVDEAGNIVVPPPGGILLTLTVRRTGGIWRVTDWPDGPVPYCDWRK